MIASEALGEFGTPGTDSDLFEREMGKGIDYLFVDGDFDRIMPGIQGDLSIFDAFIGVAIVDTTGKGCFPSCGGFSKLA
jgi:hypothetical protein